MRRNSSHINEKKFFSLKTFSFKREEILKRRKCLRRI